MKLGKLIVVMSIPAALALAAMAVWAVPQNAGKNILKMESPTDSSTSAGDPEDRGPISPASPREARMSLLRIERDIAVLDHEIKINRTQVSTMRGQHGSAQQLATAEAMGSAYEMQKAQLLSKRRALRSTLHGEGTSGHGEGPSVNGESSSR